MLNYAGEAGEAGNDQERLTWYCGGRRWGVAIITVNPGQCASAASHHPDEKLT